MNATSADRDHLRLLTIFHFVVGGIAVLCACIPLIHLTIGIVMIVAPRTFGNHPGQQPPAFVGWMFAGMGAFIFLIGQTLAVCILCAGRFLARRTHYTFVLVMACVECIFMPLGTALGVFTLIVLSRESVKALFQNNSSPPPPLQS